MYTLCCYLFEFIHTVASKTSPLWDAEGEAGSRAAWHQLLRVAECQLVFQLAWRTIFCFFQNGPQVSIQTELRAGDLNTLYTLVTNLIKEVKYLLVRVPDCVGESAR